MNTVTVVDARMGRGKTSAAIRYINEHREDRRFLFVTPYLSEVQRICTHCSFEEPAEDLGTKSADLRRKMRMKRNVAMTHALFYLMDVDMLSLARENGYSLIIDESVNVIEKIPTSAKDFTLITNTLTVEGDLGRLTWVDEEYEGRFDDYKALADQGNLFRLDTALLNITNPDLFQAFDEVIMLTYLFDGQTQKAYMDYFEIPYHVVGVEQDDQGFKFSNAPDCPPPIDIRNLVRIVDKEHMLELFWDRYSLSKNWFSKKNEDSVEIRKLRRYLNYFFVHSNSADASERIWTCYKDDAHKVLGQKGRYASSFLPLNIRATNEYRDATAVAYLVNRFCDPNLMKFFAVRGISLDNDQFALSEMVQFVWRSAVRDNKPIDLYIPSKRMRDLFINWMNSISQEGESKSE